MLSNSTSEAYSYTTIRYLIDADRNIDVPVGIVLCNADKKQLLFRLPTEDERITNVPNATANVSLEATKAKIENWLETGRLPYAQENLIPLSEAWWTQVRKLLQFRVRIGIVLPINCQHPEEEVETLFDAVVKPHVPSHERTARVSGAVTRALGRYLASQLPCGESVAGFHNRPIPVLRCISGKQQMVIVEGVNLAAATAEKDTYALTSKLRSIRNQNDDSNRRTSFVVGYLASPAGLNGEATLKEWFEKDVGIPMFDLTREPSLFRENVLNAVTSLGDELGVTTAR